jgi:hypothetical protein
VPSHLNFAATLHTVRGQELVEDLQRQGRTSLYLTSAAEHGLSPR